MLLLSAGCCGGYGFGFGGCRYGGFVGCRCIDFGYGYGYGYGLCRRQRCVDTGSPCC
jgi:hypothetical protein